MTACCIHSTRSPSIIEWQRAPCTRSVTALALWRWGRCGAAGQAEDVARVPADGLRAPRRLTAPGDHVVDLTGGLEARGQRLAGAESRVAREDQRRRGGAVGAERRTEVERQQTGGRGRIERAVTLAGEDVGGDPRALDVEAVGRGIVAGPTRVRGLDGGRHGWSPRSAASAGDGGAGLQRRGPATGDVEPALDPVALERADLGARAVDAGARDGLSPLDGNLANTPERF